MNKKIKEYDFSLIESRFRLAGYTFGGVFHKPVFRSGNGYGIRILTYTSQSLFGNNITKYDYFHLDENGVITSSPRGQAKYYNKKIKIKDISEKLAYWEDKRDLND